jgi:hypothetical protein
MGDKKDDATSRSHRLRGLLLVLISTAALAGSAFDIFLTVSWVPTIYGEDLSVDAAERSNVTSHNKPTTGAHSRSSDLHSALHNRRLEIGWFKEQFKKKLSFVCSHGECASPADIFAITPLLFTAYFWLSGRTLRNVQIGAWAKLVSQLVALASSLHLPPLPPVPKIKGLKQEWVNKLKRTTDLTLLLMLPVDIAVRFVLARELRLQLLPGHYGIVIAACDILAIFTCCLYFMFDRVVSWVAKLPVLGTSSARRRLLAVFVCILGSAAARPVAATIAQVAYHGRFPNPRFRRHPKPQRAILHVKHGFYRNPKSKKIFYVDSKGRISSRSQMKANRLQKVGNLTPDDFPYLVRDAARVGFGELALSAISQQQLGDAIYLLELGVRYEIYRAGIDQDHEVNDRVVKLFAGLCYRHRVPKRIPAIRRELVAQQLVTIFQPAPQKWLHKASDFKARWRFRKQYNSVKLIKI